MVSCSCPICALLLASVTYTAARRHILGYNLHNSPHLIPAFELDSALLRFSAKVADPESPYISDIKNEHDLKVIMTELRRTVFTEIRLWEFYVIDVISSLQELKAEIEAQAPYDASLFRHSDLEAMTLVELSIELRNEALIGAGEHGNRHHKKINTTVATSFMAALLNADFTDTASYSIDAVCAEYERVLNEVNLEFYKAYDKDVETIVTNVENRVKYIRLDAHGPKLGPITEE